MRKIPLLLACLVPFAYTACNLTPQARVSRIARNEPQAPERPWIIIDYKDRESDASIPSWIGTFLEGKEAMVEALNEYQGYYVFVAVNSSNNFAALKQWQDNFLPELDFARLAAVRIEKRFLSPLSGYPDDEYGAYYETLVRAASDMIWEGAVRKDDYWVQKRFIEEEELPGDDFPDTPLLSEIYEFYILVTVEKPVLVSQINALLLSITPEPELTRDQNISVTRVRDRFYNGF